MKATILGPTGLVGGHLLDFLLEDPVHEEIHIVHRRSAERTHSRLHEHVINMRHPEEHPEFFGVDDVFCAIGTTMSEAGSKHAFADVDYEIPRKAAQVALDAGAKRFFLVSSMGANPRSSIFYLAVKGRLEDAIASMPFRAVHILRPSILIGERDASRPGEKIGVEIARRARFLLRGRFEKYRPIKAEHVARAMVMLARRNDEGLHIFESDLIEKLVRSR